jgi:hypothetical protein
VEPVGREKFCCTVLINNDIFPELHWHPPDLLRFAIQQYHGLVCDAQILIGLEERIQITEYTFAGSSYESKSGNKKHNEHKGY